MNEFKNVYFKKIIANGPNKIESSIELSKGLNIICGPSNTGKTLIFKIFKLLFGSSNKKGTNNDDALFIIENDSGYTDFSLVISKNNDNIILSRNINSDIIHVESQSIDVDSGDYSYTAKKGYKIINDALLQIFNINPFKVPTTKDGSSTFFSLKFLDYLFFADEDRIDKAYQILLYKSSRYNSISHSFANLLYLIYDMDFTPFLRESDENKIKTSKNALEKYIDKKIDDNESEIASLKNKLNILLPNEDNSDIIQKKLNEVRITINKKYEETYKLEKIINSLNKKIESDEILIDRLESLSIQYKSDIERLNFIATGTDEFDINMCEHECPYCHSRIHENTICINPDDLKNEVKSAIDNLNDVSNTLHTLITEHNFDEEKIKSYKCEVFNIEQSIFNLINERKHLEQSLKNLDEVLECKKRIKYLSENNNLLQKDLFEISNQTKNERIDFVPTEYFTPFFYQKMTQNIKDIMRFCNDTRYTTAEFSKQEFDVSIRGQSKSANNGKGFRSFLNSITLLSFKKFLDQYGKHQLPIYVIDSPLKNLDIGELDEDNIKDNFFKYLIEASNNCQIIIMENTNNFTLTEELRKKANIIEFTRNLKPGRYGFLLDYHD